MTFYGESIAVDRYVNLAGAAVASLDDIQLRAGSSTFTAGDSVRVATDLSYTYLEPGDAAVVSWVVEVLSGSGTLTFAEGLGDTATSLGSRTVTGPAQVVIASVALTVDDVLTGTDARLLIDCTAGTLEVQQVKLRVWPPEGAGGGWSTEYPSWTQEPGAGVGIGGAYIQRSVNGGVSMAGTDGAAAWDATVADGQSHADEPWSSTAFSVAAPIAFGSSALIRVNIDTLADETGGVFDMTDLAAVVVDKQPGEGARIDPTLGLVEGVDYIQPPDEVYSDSAVQFVSTGVRSSEWVNASVNVSGADLDGTVTLAAQPYPGSLDLASWPDTSAAPLSPGDNPLTMPAGADTVLLAGSHSWMTDAPAYPATGITSEVNAAWGWALGVGAYDSPDFQPLSVRVIYPPYRVWSPALVTEEPLRLMQRGDGLGMGSGRVYGTGTRQASTRVFGSL